LDNVLTTVYQSPLPGRARVSLKVCDFGVSGTPSDFSEIPRGKMRNYPPEAMGSKLADGSPGYEYTPASDLYMFGLILWEMLHGKLVWNQFNTATANKRVMAGEMP
jgi:serine/threonine protein kinase